MSFWGIRQREYEASMRLDYDVALRNVRWLQKKRHHGVSLAVQCLSNEHLESNEGEIRAFWRDEGIADVRGFDSW